MRFAGLSPIKPTIGHSKVFAKPPPSTALCPTTPCDGIRPRRLTTKTGPPALPLRHRRDRAPPRRDRRGHAGHPRLAEIPARPPRRRTEKEDEPHRRPARRAPEQSCHDGAPPAPRRSDSPPLPLQAHGARPAGGISFSPYPWLLAELGTIGDPGQTRGGGRRTQRPSGATPGAREHRPACAGTAEEAPTEGDDVGGDGIEVPISSSRRSKSPSIAVVIKIGTGRFGP
jgi:hypothetical protein